MSTLRNWMVDLLGVLYVWINGVEQPQSSGLEFLGSGVTSTYDPVTNRNQVSVSGGITDWAAYTPTVVDSDTSSTLPGSGGAIEAYWRKTGADTLQITFSMQVGTGANFGTGFLTVSIPPGYEVDTSKYSAVGSAFLFGAGYASDVSVPTRKHLGLQDNDATSVRLVDIANSTVNDLVTATVPFTWANGDRLFFAATIPVTAV